MKRIIAIFLLVLLASALFADTPLTPDLAKDLDVMLCSHKELQKYDGYIIWTAPIGEHNGNLYDGAKQYSSVQDFLANHRKGNILLYVIGVTNNNGRAELSRKVYYLGKTNSNDDIAYRKKPKVYFKNASRLLEYEITCEPTWF